MTAFGDFNLKFPLILAIYVFISSFNFMPSSLEHEKSFITLGPVLGLSHMCLEPGYTHISEMIKQ